MQRWYAKQISKSRDTWGIWDREADAWSMENGERWQSSRAGALICADKWTRQGYQTDPAGEGEEEHEHHFPVLKVLEDGPVIGDCVCGMTFDEYNEEQNDRE